MAVETHAEAMTPQPRLGVDIGRVIIDGSAHPGGGLPIVALSAKIVAGLIGPA